MDPLTVKQLNREKIKCVTESRIESLALDTYRNSSEQHSRQWVRYLLNLHWENYLMSWRI